MTDKTTEALIRAVDHDYKNATGQIFDLPWETQNAIDRGAFPPEACEDFPEIKDEEIARHNARMAEVYGFGTDRWTEIQGDPVRRQAFDEAMNRFAGRPGLRAHMMPDAIKRVEQYDGPVVLGCPAGALNSQSILGEYRGVMDDDFLELLESFEARSNPVRRDPHGRAVDLRTMDPADAAELHDALVEGFAAMDRFVGRPGLRAHMTPDAIKRVERYDGPVVIGGAYCEDPNEFATELLKSMSNHGK